MSLDQYGISQEFSGKGDWPETSEGEAPVKPTTLDGFKGIPDIHYNPLQAYTNTTYNTRLTMMPAREKTFERKHRSFDYTKGIIMWETGGTGTIYLEEMELRTAGIGNDSDAFNASRLAEIKGKLIEPTGGRFIESIAIASPILEYASNTECIYLLEIYFTGYDKNDLPVICKGWKGEPQIYRWYVTMPTLVMTLDFKGATYEFTMIDSNSSALSPDAMTFEEGFKMQSKSPTVGGFCTELSKALNDRQNHSVKAGGRGHPNRYVITPHKDIANCKFDVGLGSKIWRFAFGNEKTAAAHTTILQFIGNALSQSSDLLKILHRVNDGKKAYNAADTKPNTLGKIFNVLGYASGVRAIEGPDKLPIWDDKINGYVYEYHYFLYLKPEYSAGTPQEYKDSQDPDQRRARVDEWIRFGLLRKVYKWTHTGENTEVLSCNLKFDNLFRIVQPLWISSETGKPLTGSAMQPTTQLKKDSAGKIDQINSSKMLNTLQSVSGGKQAYAEDLLSRLGAQKSEWRALHLPKRYLMNTEVQQTQSSTTFFAEGAIEFSIYKQIVAGAGTGNTGAAAIELEVIGDPYFLMQIPEFKGTVPWESDVWEWEQNHFSQEQLAEKRKTAGTYDIQPILYFEAVIPSQGWTSSDTMELRTSDAISGLFIMTTVTNKFSKGKFTSHLNAVRDPLANPWPATKAKIAATLTTGASESKTAAATGPNNAGLSSSPKVSYTNPTGINFGPPKK